MDPIGFDGGDFVLYRYVRNRPTEDVDPSGLLEWTVDAPEKADCGNFEWLAAFRPVPMKETSGFIIQHVVAIGVARNCDTPPKTGFRTRKCPLSFSRDEGVPELLEYWELWQIVKNFNPGSDLPLVINPNKPQLGLAGDDVFKLTIPRPSCGGYIIKGEVYYDKGKLDPKTNKLAPTNGWEFWQDHVVYAKTLPSSCKKPTVTTGTGLTGAPGTGLWRMVADIWSCCAVPKNEHSIFIWMESSTDSLPSIKVW